MIVLILCCLATWRLAHMVVKETGPLSVFAKLRANRARKQKRIGGSFDMLSCVACASIYIGAVVALWPAGDVVTWFVYTLAFSAVATILEHFMR